MSNVGRHVDAVQQHVRHAKQVRQWLLLDPQHRTLQQLFVVGCFDLFPQIFDGAWQKPARPTGGVQYLLAKLRVDYIDHELRDGSGRVVFPRVASALQVFQDLLIEIAENVPVLRAVEIETLIELIDEQKLKAPASVNISSARCEKVLASIGRSYSVRMAFYQAAWELVSNCVLFPSEPRDWMIDEILSSLANDAALPLLISAEASIQDVRHAEVWTTVLRDRRNALHWGKAKSIVADHSETGTILMGAPLHIGKLEAIRIAAGSSPPVA